MTDCTAAVHDNRLEGWVDGKAGRVVHSSQRFLAIPHLTGWTNRLSELTSPWERPTASLIHNSLLFLYIPIISSCTVETLRISQCCFFVFLCLGSPPLFIKTTDQCQFSQFCKRNKMPQNVGKCYVRATLEIQILDSMFSG